MRFWPWLVGGPKHGEQIEINDLAKQYGRFEICIPRPMTWSVVLEEELTPQAVLDYDVRSYIARTFVFPYSIQFDGESIFNVMVFDHHDPIKDNWDPNHWPNLALCECTQKSRY